MIKPKIKRLHQQGYSQISIRKKLGCSKSHISETISTKKCMKIPFRITRNEFKTIKQMRNGK